MNFGKIVGVFQFEPITGEAPVEEVPVTPVPAEETPVEEPTTEQEPVAV